MAKGKPKPMMRGEWPPTPVMAGNNDSKANMGKKKKPMQAKGKGPRRTGMKRNMAKMAKGMNLSS